ncbi:hypothetical protein BCR42DRAFT_440127 [Absidia repens]|uniref:BZIP domain-containing protein n=1 Tax=Absidia repens TaxID=90262 RepID=A0A1X2I9Z7_9FUNG|nr:hypothetical protein BCR42DRAFT_440127 [Absidia repens]
MNCDQHLPMEDGTWSSHMEGLDNVTEPITILTDAELQNQLSRYATTQFTFDDLPHIPVENKPDTFNHMNIHPSVHPNYPLPNLVIDTMNNNDPCSSTISSPYDPQQHYFTPISSLPTSPTLNDLGNYYKTSPPYSSLMLSPMSHQPQPQQIFPIQGPETHYVPQFQDASLITTNKCTKKQPAARCRGITPSTTRGRPQQRQRTARVPMTTPTTTTHEAEPNANSSMIHEMANDTIHSNDNNNNDDDDGNDDDINYLIAPSRDDPNTLGATTEPMPAVRLSKRQRNTAASARFRIKKKLREQCLQRTACEMTNKAIFMENRVHELEREVKWLKELLVTKNGCSYC